jgi:hypothetical protein
MHWCLHDETFKTEFAAPYARVHKNAAAAADWDWKIMKKTRIAIQQRNRTKLFGQV